MRAALIKYYAYRLAPRLTATALRWLVRRRRPAPRGAAPVAFEPTRLLEQADDLQRRAAQQREPEQLVDLVLRFPWIAPDQNPGEITGLLRRLARHPPLRLCEIGSSRGGTLFLFSQVAAADARILSIDVNTDSLRRELFAQLVRPGQRLTCLTDSSHAAATVEQFRAWLGDDPLDFLFIDGDHSADGVARDYADYAPHVRPGGLVAFHDIVPDYRTRYRVDTGTYTGGVPQFWARLSRELPGCEELIDHRLQDGLGIGLVEVRR